MPAAAEKKLRTPDSWVRELASSFLDQVPRPAPVVIALTYRLGLPDRLAQDGIALGDVQSDLRAGLVSERRSGGNSDYYILSGTRFKVFVHTEPEADALSRGLEVPLAIISKVQRQQGLPRHGRLVQASVTACRPYDRAACDIAEVHEQVLAWLRYRDAERDAWQRSRRLLSRAVRGSVAYSDLHARVLRHFSALEQMIELLQQRSDTSGSSRARGIITEDPDPSPDMLRVRLSERDRDFGNYPAAQVQAPGQRRALNLEIVAIDEDDLYVSRPEDRRSQEALSPGTHVELSSKPRFGLGRHSYALGRLLREEVEGDWESLARLVTDPRSLQAPDQYPPLGRYFNGQLNVRQRLAVDGAVQAPSAYFIQGPPGTGKTTVICEIVRQLTSRGERVLLLAPMHVAVDEVLERVGDAGGVLALRASYDDSKVREEVRRFTKDKLAAEFVRKARTPASARADQWAAEARTLQAECELITGCIRSWQEARRSQAALQEAISRREASRAAYQEAIDIAVLRSEASARALAHARGRLAEAEHTAQAARHARSEAESGGASLIQRLQGLLGAGKLGKLRRADQAADREQLTAAKNLRDASAAHDQRKAAAAQLRQDSRARDDQQTDACSRAAETARTAEQAVGRLRSALTSAGLGDAGEDELASRAQLNRDRQARLERLAYLENRWFRLTGLAGTMPPDRQEQVVRDLGDRLMGAANLICCTTTGFGGDQDLRDADYDTLIIDEASRVIDSEFLIGAKQAHRWILVGDEHQLPPFVDPADERHLHALAALHMTERGAADGLSVAVARLSELWHEDEEMHQFRARSAEDAARQMSADGHWQQTYRPSYQKAYERLRQHDANAERELLRKMRHHLVQSIFDRCVAEAPVGLRCRLTEQRRMIDPIAALVREPIYAGNYLTPPPEVLSVAPLTTSRTFTEPVIFLDTSGYPHAGETIEGTGFSNGLEAKWVASACRAWDRELAAQGEREVTISILTFYKAQVRKIRGELGAPRYPGFRVLRFRNVDTIDRLQGQQADLVMISFCRARPGRPRERPGLGIWLQDVRRLNVACTRAKRAIMLVGHKDTLASLRGIEAAEKFYAHMFGLFAQPAAGTVLLKQIEGPGT